MGIFTQSEKLARIDMQMLLNRIVDIASVPPTQIDQPQLLRVVKQLQDI